MEKNKVGNRDKELPKMFKQSGYLSPLQEDLEEIMQNTAQRDDKYGRDLKIWGTEWGVP